RRRAPALSPKCIVATGGERNTPSHPGRQAPLDSPARAVYAETGRAGRGDLMTESEWLLSRDHAAMLQGLARQPSERELRLFACACCRLLWPELIDERSRAAVEAAERSADGLLSDEEREAFFHEASQASREVLRPSGASDTTLRFRRPRD